MNLNASKPQRISASDLHRLQTAGQVDILDVRSAPEYRSVRVPGTRLVPVEELTPENARVTPGQPVYVICQSGHRSMIACRMLAKAGIEAINVDGGIMAWIQAGFPVEQERGTLRITR